MSGKQQPEALRLAHALSGGKLIDDSTEWADTLHAAAVELRHQHARIAELESQLAQRFDAAAHGPTSGAADLPEALRVPLDSLHADAGYLCGRLLNGSLTQEQVVESIRRRIDAAKLAALTAQAISAEPAEHVQNPAENEHVAGDVSGNGAGLNMSTPHARITELESQLAQRFDAADVATAAAQQGVAYAALPEPDLFADCDSEGGFLGDTSDVRVLNTALFRERSMRAFADATYALRASHGQAPAKPDPAYSAACNLATALFKKHFAHLPDFASGQAVWSLCDSTAGVISQIDNMVSGLVQPPTTAFSEDEL